MVSSAAAAMSTKKKSPALPSSSSKTPSKKASFEANTEFHDVGLSYAASPEDNGAGGGLRGLKQLNFPELASWSNLQCRKFLQDHGVLSDELPRCWGCLEPMSRTSRLENAPLKCETPACYLHPLLQCPREAWTPLHSQARQLLVVLSVFLDSKSSSPASFFNS